MKAPSQLARSCTAGASQGGQRSVEVSAGMRACMPQQVNHGECCFPSHSAPKRAKLAQPAAHVRPARGPHLQPRRLQHHWDALPLRHLQHHPPHGALRPAADQYQLVGGRSFCQHAGAAAAPGTGRRRGPARQTQGTTHSCDLHCSPQHRLPAPLPRLALPCPAPARPPAARPPLPCTACRPGQHRSWSSSPPGLSHRAPPVGSASRWGHG